MPQQVAGGDDEVGLQLGQGADEALLVPLPGRHVQVGEVQHRERCGSDRQHRDGHAAEGVRVPLDHGAPEAGAGPERQRGAGEHAGYRHL